MKILNLLTSISLLFCLNSQLFGNNRYAGEIPGSKTVKAEDLKCKFNAGELSTSAFAFTENKGQIFGYDGLPHPEVKFSFQQGNTQIFLLEKGIAYQFTSVHYPEGYQKLMRDKFADSKDFEKMDELQKQIRTETFRMDMTLTGANPNAEITTEGKSKDHTNFYNHDVLDVRSYSKIIYHDIYPGIDWVIYTKGKELKYDFVVKPGADPALIKMQFDHQEELKLNDNGTFTLKNRLGEISEKKPVSFQNAEEIKTDFVLKDNSISFKLENYSTRNNLTIDPALVWGTYYGGSGVDGATSCTTDAFGNVYLAGYTSASASIASSGYQNTFGGGSFDAFLVKFNSAGIRQWATYYGGTNNDTGNSCATDVSGNVYLAGSTSSSASIASSGHQNTFGGGSSDAFLVKLNSSGVRQWATYYGGSSPEDGFSCANDALGNVCLVGRTLSTTSIVSGGHQSNKNGGNDAFLVKFSSGGIRQWGTYYGGDLDDCGYDCACDTSGNVYLTGITSSTNAIASGGHQNTYGGLGCCANDAFLVKFNSSGIRQWGSYYGGTGDDQANSCTTDISGNVYLAGYTESSSGIASGGFQNTFAGGGTDAFLVKFNSGGNRQWGTYLGGSSADFVDQSIIDGQGNIFIAGITSSTLGIASGGYQNIYAGGYDAFIVKFNSSGLRQWGTYYGGSSSDEGTSCTVDGSGNIYLAGLTASTDSIASNGHQNIYAGGGLYDAFIAKFIDCNSPTISPAGTTTFCPIYSVTLSAPPSMTSYSWSTGATTQTISVNDGGNYSVVITGTNGCTATSAPVTIINVLPADFNKNGTVNVNDFLMFATTYGTICNCVEDLDDDGDVDVSDFLIFAPRYGQSCQ